jgi:hypothetical protein
MMLLMISLTDAQAHSLTQSLTHTHSLSLSLSLSLLFSAHSHARSLFGGNMGYPPPPFVEGLRVNRTLEKLRRVFVCVCVSGGLCGWIFVCLCTPADLHAACLSRRLMLRRSPARSRRTQA